MNLQDLVIQSAHRTPDALAIKGPDRSMTYAELDRRAAILARLLIQQGVRQGDRVGIWLEKSTSTIVAMQGVLRAGAIYIPLDPLSPATRVHTILCDCTMSLVVTTRKRATILQAYGRQDGQSMPRYLHIDEVLWDLPVTGQTIALSAPEDEIAYILYTSGSTGKPKGVCISHRNALAFITWAAETLQAGPTDRFANHAPFHFDLSVLDLYVAFLTGACALLIPDAITFLPQGLVHFLVHERPTIWYSVPSALVLMMDQGALLEQETLSLRCLLFAGEPFPIKQLRRLYTRWSGIRFLNLYGPTETNVCTFYEVSELSEERSRPVPIGRACSGDTVWAQKADGSRAKPGEEGELLVSGPTVMAGYWNQPRQGTQPYATGDLVRLLPDGNYEYIGRRDHMVKVHGHRVEPGDIEAALLEHPTIHEVAVLVIGSELDARLIAFIVTKDATTPSLLEIKRHCAERLPRYMIVDSVNFLSALPHTRNGKVDRLALNKLAMAEKVPETV